MGNRKPAEGSGEEVGLSVGEGDGLGVGEGLADMVGLGEGVGLGVGVGLGLGEGMAGMSGHCWIGNSLSSFQ